MTAQQAQSETRLPRAVLKMSEDIRRKYETDRRPPAEQPATAAATAASEETTAPTDAVEQAAPTEAQDPRHSDPVYWKNRFKVTEGILHAERTRTKSQLDSLRTEIEQLQEQVRTLQASKPTEERIDIQAYFTPDQIEQFGEEHCQAMAEAAHRASTAKVKEAIEAEVAPLRNRQKAEAADAAEARNRAYTDALGAEVPDYLEVDATDGWRAWLAQEDPATGMIRQEILNTHHGAQNAKKVARMFKDYAASKVKAEAEAPKPPITPHGNAGGQDAQIPRQAPAGGPPSKAEITAFYTRSALGKLKQGEREQFEARLALLHGA